MKPIREQIFFFRLYNSVLALLVCSGLCFGQTNWEWRNPLPQGNDLNSVAYGKNTFVAVGNSGTILTSPDSIHWTPKKSGVSDPLKTVTYSDSLFVAVGCSGSILTSSDGTIWSRKNSGTTSQLNSVAHGSDRFVVVGYTGVILTSSDASSWKKENLGSTDSLTSVTYGNNQFVAVGWNGAIFTSPNGTAWTRQSSGAIYCLWSVAYGGNKFVAVGDAAENIGTILISVDGKAWTKENSTNDLNSVVYCNRLSTGQAGLFIGVGDGGIIITSPDGSTWTKETSGTTKDLFSTAYGNGQFVTVGDWCGTILTSSDGSIWTQRNSGTADGFCFVTHCTSLSGGQAGQFIICNSGNGGLLFSPEGLIWTKITMPTNSHINFVASGNGQLVAVGSAGAILTSSDGETWNAKNSGTTFNLKCVAYGNGMFVTMGESFDPAWGPQTTLLYSPDATTWKTASSPTLWSSVMYANNQFVGVGLQSIYTSIDGKNWTEKYSQTMYDLFAIAYADSLPPGKTVKFVVVGYGGRIVTSPDAANWTVTILDSTLLLTSVAYGNKQFVAVGYTGEILTSLDGTSWTRKYSPTTYPLQSVAYYNNRFVAVGTGGTILTSEADILENANQPDIKTLSNDRIKTKTSNNVFSILLPNAAQSGNFKIELFTVSGKNVFNATTTANNGILKIPTIGLPAGKYFVSIMDKNKNLLSSSFSLMR